MTEKNVLKQNVLRTTALITVLIGALGSLVLMFNAGRNQNSVVLLTLFTIWVLSPFGGLLVADKFTRSWSRPARVMLYWLMIVLAIASLIAYSGALNPPEMKPAFIFLVVPPVSWLLMAVVILGAKVISKKSSK